MEAYEKVARQVRLELLGEGNEKNTWYLHMLAVLPEYQCKGIGKALVNYVTDKVPIFSYEVLNRGRPTKKD